MLSSQSLSSLKTSQTPVLEKRNLKVTFKKPDNVVVAVSEYLSKESTEPYFNVLHSLKTEDVDNKLLKSWLCQLQENITILTRQCEGLVDALLYLDWPSQDDDIVQAYTKWILTLVSAHTCYLRLVLKELIVHFIPKENMRQDGVSGETSKIEQAVQHTNKFENVHFVLKSILRIVPLMPSVLVPLLSECFPFIKKSGSIQECYMRNLIVICEYLPSHRKDILEIIVDKMLKIDAHCPKNQIEDAEAAKEEADELENFDMDDPSTSHLTQGMAHDLANTLDTMMKVMFEYIHNVCFKDGEINWESTKLLYKEMLAIFDNLVLPTFACFHVQFLWFYLISLKECLSEIFLDYLWKKVVNPNTPMIIRQSAVAYICSLISRGQYISISTAMACLDVMTAWIHQYISAHDNTVSFNCNTSVHGTFYSVCQATFYIFAFRHKEMWRMPKGPVCLRSINFERIVTCSLNPLKVCLPAVVRNFAAVARHYQLVYCYTIIERNNRMVLPVANSSDYKSCISVIPVDSFFPFDPYLLLRSSKFVAPLYREYDDHFEEENLIHVEVAEDLFEYEDILTTASPVLQEFLLCGSSPGFNSVSSPWLQ